MRNSITGSSAKISELQNDQCKEILHVHVKDKDEIKLIYDFGEVLGQGGFGTVRLVKEKGTENIYAAKVVKKSIGSPLRLEQMEREVEILKHVSHPCIVKVKEVYDTPKAIYMIMEWCQGGDLVDYVSKMKEINESHIRVIMNKIMDAIAFLHDNGIVHRDLKPENILLRKTGDLGFDLCVSDFGLATLNGTSMTIGTSEMMDNMVGTTTYMDVISAPEVQGNVGYSKQCDIWSVGVMMFLLFCKFDKEAMVNLREMVDSKKIAFEGPRWEGISNAAKHCIERMLRLDPAERATAKEILKHPWMLGHEDVDSKYNATATVLDMMRSYNSERRLKEKIMFVVYAACILSYPYLPKSLEYHDEEENESHSMELPSINIGPKHQPKKTTSTPSLPDIAKSSRSSKTSEISKHEKPNLNKNFGGSSKRLSTISLQTNKGNHRISNDDISPQPRSKTGSVSDVSNYRRTSVDNRLRKKEGAKK
ncbi:Pkinase-domain-containing protein [Rozella allomycis CSF55]|uniref:Pkinase-domain-containing protein n=1 Tax=Rozella allomycis (strain CSF55) TaxID=988480 RepID=A0A075AT02_ROZAC|nr:Protein kinase, catalytic domain-containing protein [Rozella allomycis CSF55]RKP21194.1 Pkinase-domain-containing protein [Rozella allomycis CSF55]|eukprot:EPZ31618.1 Protein kinase, catalytic domain-containing protein [Rozella allomycis CSF55]